MINNSNEILKRIIRRVNDEVKVSSGMSSGVPSYYASGYCDAMNIVELIINQELQRDSHITIEEVLKNENTRVTI